jgi:hypothetical protein
MGVNAVSGMDPTNIRPARLAAPPPLSVAALPAGARAILRVLTGRKPRIANGAILPARQPPPRSPRALVAGGADPRGDVG